MCYDIYSSISSWIVSNSIAIYIYRRNRRYDRWNAMFISIFSTVQLLEAGVWWTIKQGLPSISNMILTKFILLVLLMQPLVQTYFGAKETRSNLLNFMVYVYFGMLLWGFWRLGTAPKGSFYTAPNANGNLVWHDTSSETFLGGDHPYLVTGLYLGGLIVPLLFQKDHRGLPLIAVGVGSLLYSMFIADKESFSSLWCYYAVIYSLVALTC